MTEGKRLNMSNSDIYDDYEENEFPIAYLLTFRTYGTWLHGDQRTSYRRTRTTKTQRKLIFPNVPLEEVMREEMDQEPFILDIEHRKIVEAAVKEVCIHRNYKLFGVSVRSNHAHSVIGAQAKPERIVDTLKAYSTRRLRENRLIGEATKVWSRGRSRRYLWKPRHVNAAIDYVLYCQGDMPFELDD